MAKVYVLDHETFKTEDGGLFTVHATPKEPAPDGRFDSDKWGFHDVLAKWVPLDKIDEPCEAELDVGE